MEGGGGGPAHGVVFRGRHALGAGPEVDVVAAGLGDVPGLDRGERREQDEQEPEDDRAAGQAAHQRVGVWTQPEAGRDAERGGEDAAEREGHGEDVELLARCAGLGDEAEQRRERAERRREGDEDAGDAERLGRGERAEQELASAQRARGGCGGDPGRAGVGRG
jgi:hypothetical protein